MFDISCKCLSEESYLELKILDTLEFDQQRGVTQSSQHRYATVCAFSLGSCTHIRESVDFSVAWLKVNGCTFKGANSIKIICLTSELEGSTLSTLFLSPLIKGLL